MIETLSTIGEARFCKLSSADEYLAKVDGASTFSVHLGKCYSCGGDHMLPDCRKDKDEARIAAAQKKKMWIVAALKAMIKAEEDVVDSERMGVYVDVDKDATAAAVDADV